MTSRARRAAGAIVGVGVLASAVAAQAAEPNLAFEDDRALTVPWSRLATPARFSVCNLGAARVPPTAPAKASLAGFQFTRRGAPVETGDVIDLRPTQLAPDAGACSELRLARGAQTPDAGEYEGVIVVRRDTAITRRELKITGPAPVQPAAEEVNLHASRGGPTDDSIGLDEPRSIPLRARPTRSFAVAEPGTTIGVLQNGASRARVVVTGPPQTSGGVRSLPVRIEPSGDVGTYSGTVDLATGMQQSAPVKLKLEASDGRRWAVLAILLGIALTSLATWLLQHTLPRMDLNQRRRRLDNRYEHARQSFATTFEGKRFANYQPSADAIERYQNRLKQSIKNYARSNVLFDRASDDYKALVERLRIAENDADFYGDRDGFGAHLTTLEDKLEEFGTRFPGSPPPFIANAAALLDPKPLGVGTATGIAAEADAHVTLADRWMALAVYAKRLAAWIRALETANLPPDEAKRVDAARERVVGASNELRTLVSADELPKRRVERELDAAYLLLEPLGAHAWIPSEDGVRDDPFLPPDQSFRGVVAAPPRAGQVAVFAESAYEVLAKGAMSFGVFGVLGFGVVTALLTALPTAFADDTFGTWRDYVLAVGLGAGTSAAAKALFESLTHLVRRD